jgi:hypothetical protein
MGSPPPPKRRSRASRSGPGCCSRACVCVAGSCLLDQRRRANGRRYSIPKGTRSHHPARSRVSRRTRRECALTPNAGSCSPGTMRKMAAPKTPFRSAAITAALRTPDLSCADLEHAGPRRPARSWRHGATPPKPREGGPRSRRLRVPRSNETRSSTRRAYRLLRPDSEGLRVRAVVGDVVRTVAPSTETTNEPAVYVICRGPNKRYG